MNSTNPHETIDLVSLINEGRDGEINMTNLSNKIRIGNNIRPLRNMIDVYMDFIMPLSIPIRLTEEEYLKFKYNPKALSLQLYGTIELWFLIMRLNRCPSLMNFNMKKIRVLHPKDIEIINKILILSEDRLKHSNIKMYSEDAELYSHSDR